MDGVGWLGMAVGTCETWPRRRAGAWRRGGGDRAVCVCVQLTSAWVCRCFVSVTSGNHGRVSRIHCTRIGFGGGGGGGILALLGCLGGEGKMLLLGHHAAAERVSRSDDDSRRGCVGDNGDGVTGIGHWANLPIWGHWRTLTWPASAQSVQVLGCIGTAETGSACGGRDIS